MPRRPSPTFMKLCSKLPSTSATPTLTTAQSLRRLGKSSQHHPLISPQRRNNRRRIVLVKQRHLPASIHSAVAKFGSRSAAGITKPGFAAGREPLVERVQQRINVRSIVGNIRGNDQRKLFVITGRFPVH